MTQRITLTVSDDLAERLSWLASHYDCDILDLMQELIQDGAHVCETAIEREACEKIKYLTHIAPAGRA